MRTFRVTAALLAALAAAPLAAQENSQPDAEQIGQDMIKNLDAMIGRIADKLESDKPVTGADFDSIFGESFFTSSQDPIGDLEKVQSRVNARLGDKKAKFEEPYSKWVGGKMSAADLKPEVVRDDEHVTVNLDAPRDAAEAMKVDIAGNLIKMSYTRQENRSVANPDGSVSSSSFARTQRRAMAVPKGANPASYRVAAEGGRVSIIFDRIRKGKTKTEAAK